MLGRGLVPGCASAVPVLPRAAGSCGCCEELAAGLDCPPWPVSSIMESNLTDILEHHPKASTSPGKRIGTKDAGMLRLVGTWGRRDTLPLHILGLGSPTRSRTEGTGVAAAAGAGSCRLRRGHPLGTEPAAAPPGTIVPPRAGTAGRGGPVPPLQKSAFPIGRALNVLAAKGWASRGRTQPRCGDAGMWGRAPGRWQEELARSWHQSGL